jgi:hypothetical protein
VFFFVQTKELLMQIVRDPADAARISDPELRSRVQKTMAALSEDNPYDAEALGYFLIVQRGDTLAMLDAQIGFSILTNRWSGIRFDQPGYTPAFEILEEHAGYYEMVFIISDDGYGIEVLIPKAIDIPELLDLCQTYALAAGGDAVLTVLAQVPRWAGCSYVVPNPKTKKPYLSIFCSWNTARKAAGLPEVRMHDLRHSMASNMVNSGRSI